MDCPPAFQFDTRMPVDKSSSAQQGHPRPWKVLSEHTASHMDSPASVTPCQFAMASNLNSNMDKRSLLKPPHESRQESCDHCSTSVRSQSYWGRCMLLEGPSHNACSFIFAGVTLCSIAGGTHEHVLGCHFVVRKCPRSLEFSRCCLCLRNFVGLASHSGAQAWSAQFPEVVRDAPVHHQNLRVTAIMQ